MLMTLDICLISVDSVTFSLAYSFHTLEPSPKLHPMLRMTICSLFLESPNFKYSVVLPNQMSDHMFHIFFGEICSPMYASVHPKLWSRFLLVLLDSLWKMLLIKNATLMSSSMGSIPSEPAFLRCCSYVLPGLSILPSTGHNPSLRFPSLTQLESPSLVYLVKRRVRGAALHL